MSYGSVLLRLGLLVATTGCGEGAEGNGAAPASVRDSAGVRIVVSADAAWGTEPAWSLDPEPLVSVGTVDGEGPASFGEVADVVRSPDGRLVVLDGRAQEVRVFGPAGGHQTTFGRDGDGPGEFRRAAHLQLLPGDTALVQDPSNGRLSRFLLSGAFLGARDLTAVTFRGEPAFLDEPHLRSDGSLLAHDRNHFQRGEDALVQDTFYLFHVPPDEDEAQPIAVLPSVRTVSLEWEGRRLFTVQPFNQWPLWAASGDRTILALAEEFRVQRFGPEGLELVARRDLAPPELTEERVATFREAREGGIPEEEAPIVRRLWEATPLPDRVPAYQDLLLDPGGHMWVERYGQGTSTAGPGWDVYDPEGRYLGAVPNLPNLKVHQVDEEVVTGVWTDEFDVPHVRVHRILR